MLDRVFAPDVERILSFAPRRRQTALFSATIEAWVHDIAAKHLTDPLTVRVDPLPEDAAPSVDQIVYEVPDGHKQAVLETLLERRGEGSVVVFGRTKHGVKKLGAKLAAKGFPVVTLQGNLSQNARDRAMAAFRAGELPVLVATNVAARGLDVSNVERVINFELPESAGLFTHRTGRTGRMGRQGEAITLISPSELAQWRKLERELGRKLPTRRWSEPLAALPEEPRSPRQSAPREESAGRPQRAGNRQAREAAAPKGERLTQARPALRAVRQDVERGSQNTGRQPAARFARLTPPSAAPERARTAGDRPAPRPIKAAPIAPRPAGKRWTWRGRDGGQHRNGGLPQRDVLR
jgi:superfamily II DNA/RNA helicase